MRACATANALVFSLVFAAAGFTACASGSPPPPPAPAADNAAPPATVAAAPAAPAPKAKIVPKTAADCKQLLSDITNDPPNGGVVVNNAMTARDAGAGDRFESVTGLIKANRDGFRCCFDVWAKDHAGAAGEVKMVVKLKPDGSVINVSFGDAPNRVNAPEVEGCMSDLAKGLSYPRSPSGKETTFTYPFDFKARH